MTAMAGPRAALAFLHPVAMGVLLGQGWHVYSGVFSRGQALGLGVCSGALLLGLVAALYHASNAGPGQASQRRTALFWMSCTLNGGLAAIAQLRQRLGRLHSMEDALAVNAFLSSGLLGASLPHIALKVAGRPEAEVILPCLLAVLVTEAACSHEALPALKVLVATFLLTVGIQGMSADDRSQHRDAGAGAAAEQAEEPFLPATVLEERSYSPQFLLNQRAQCVPRHTAVVPLVSVVARQAGSEPARPRGKERPRRPRPPQEEAPRAIPEIQAAAGVGSDIRWEVVMEEMQRVDGRAAPPPAPPAPPPEERKELREEEEEDCLEEVKAEILTTHVDFEEEEALPSEALPSATLPSEAPPAPSAPAPPASARLQSLPLSQAHAFGMDADEYDVPWLEAQAPAPVELESAEAPAEAGRSRRSRRQRGRGKGRELEPEARGLPLVELEGRGTVEELGSSSLSAAAMEFVPAEAVVRQELRADAQAFCPSFVAMEAPTASPMVMPEAAQTEAGQDSWNTPFGIEWGQASNGAQQVPDSAEGKKGEVVYEGFECGMGTWEEYVPYEQQMPAAEEWAGYAGAEYNQVDFGYTEAPGRNFLSAAAAEFVPGSWEPQEQAAEPVESLMGPPVESLMGPPVESLMGPPVESLMGPELPDPGLGRASALRRGDGPELEGTFYAEPAEGKEELWGELEQKRELDRSVEGKGSQGSDAEVCWAYVDPNDEVQLGFSSAEMRKWHQQGYFDGDLRLALLRCPPAKGKWMAAPPKREFYPLKEWFPDLARSFSYVPNF